MTAENLKKMNIATCRRVVKSPRLARFDLNLIAATARRISLVVMLATVSVTVLSNDHQALKSTRIDPIREMQARTNAQLALARQRFLYHLSTTDRVRVGTDRIVGLAAAENLYSVAFINYGQARILHAEAFSRELDNMLKRVEIHYERKIVHDVKVMEMDYIRQLKRSQYLDDKKWSNGREWERLKNHPELCEGKVESGEVLNFLLKKLEAGLLPYEFDARDPDYVEAVPKWLKLDPEELKYINLKIEGVSFVASNSGDAESIQWPQILRWNEFNPIRENFERQRESLRALSKSAEPIPPESIDRLFKVLTELEKVLLETVDVKRKVSERRIFTEQHRCRLFIKRLRDEVKIVGATGRMQPHMRYDPSIDGANLISLLTFMSRNGARFERANIGAGSTYFGLYNKMRAWCLSLEESDVNYAPIFVGSAGDSE